MNIGARDFLYTKVKMHAQKNWQKRDNFDDHVHRKDHNMLALRLDNFFSLDIDNMDHWNLYLQNRGHTIDDFERSNPK